VLKLQKNRFRIYCGRPITGCSGKEIFDYYRRVYRRLTGIGYDVLIPMVKKEFVRYLPSISSMGYEDKPAATSQAIVSRDLWMVRYCDIFLLNLLRAKRISVGAMFELAVAHEQRKHVVLVMEPDNVHKHAFVSICADIIFGSEKNAFDYLKKFAKQKF